MPIKRIMTVLAACALVCFTVTGLWSQANGQHEKMEEGEPIKKAVANLIPTKGSEVTGRITFTHDGKKIHVKGEISGLTPGDHGFHIHEFGVWSEDGLAAGSHFNPTKAPHAGPESPKRHVGDLGNVTASASGHAVIDVEDSHLSFHGPHSIIGRGLVVHVKPDDLKTQTPPGNAGGRLAVGVIGVAKP
jgi:Cu-Zn family superoxide dismutase